MKNLIIIVGILFILTISIYGKQKIPDVEGNTSKNEPAGTNILSQQTELQKAPNTDELQEKLFNYILSSIKKTNLIVSEKPKNKTIFLKNIQKYYNNIIQDNNIITIPYPAFNLKGLKFIHYLIPDEYFSNKANSNGIVPQITLTYNSDNSTVIFNNSIPISFYRSPKIKKSSLNDITSAIQDIYKLLLPLPKDKSKRIEGKIKYKGYKIHELELNTSDQWLNLFEVFRQQGELYYYPSKIDDMDKFLVIHGLFYVMHSEKNYYHFAESEATFVKDEKPSTIKLNMTFYPFIKKIEGEEYKTNK